MCDPLPAPYPSILKKKTIPFRPFILPKKASGLLRPYQARAVKHIDIKGRRILELGCGLGLPSLGLQARGADVTASNRHPLSEPFLDYNAALNHLPEVPPTKAAYSIGHSKTGAGMLGKLQFVYYGHR